LRAVSIFSLRRPETAAGRGRLYVARVEIGITTGEVIEAQYLCAAGFLIVTSYDVPYEEELYFSLRANTSFKLLDEMMLGSPYTPGTFSQPVVSEPDALLFSFFGADQWRLQVLARPRKVYVKNWFGPARYTRRLPAMHFLQLRRSGRLYRSLSACASNARRKNGGGKMVLNGILRAPQSPFGINIKNGNSSICENPDPRDAYCSHHRWFVFLWRKSNA
jgi:hypothetical protein